MNYNPRLCQGYVPLRRAAQLAAAHLADLLLAHGAQPAPGRHMLALGQDLLLLDSQQLLHALYLSGLTPTLVSYMNLCINMCHAASPIQ